MAQIIYKKGFEDRNKLEYIEGIEIELLNGQKALIYPKYAERIMLREDRVLSLGEKWTTEIEALKREDNVYATEALLMCKSPAAEYVSSFRSDRYGIFRLPTLLAAMELQHQKEDVDALAETIEGADLLRHNQSIVWSCSRYSKNRCWFANGHFGYSFGIYFHYSLLTVPIVLYK